MICPRCKRQSSVVKTMVLPRSEVVRYRECDEEFGGCGIGWTSRELIEVGSIRDKRDPLIGTNETALIPTNRNGQYPLVATSNGGVGGALVSSSFHPDPESALSKSNLGDLRFNGRRRRRLPAGYTADFEAFWAAYPQWRRVKKAVAFASWQAARPDLAAVLSALAWQVNCEDWTKDNGAYVPHPSSYLNQRRWEDEPPAPRPSTNGKTWRF